MLRRWSSPGRIAALGGHGRKITTKHTKQHEENRAFQTYKHTKQHEPRESNPGAINKAAVLNDETSSFILHPSSSDAGKRLDAFLAENIDGWSRSRLQRLIEGGDVLVNEKEVKPSYKIREGDEIDIDLTEEPAARFEPENIPLEIVFEDEYLAVINKPAGMIVHPGAGNYSGTLANAIAWHFGHTAETSEPPAVAGGLSQDIREQVGHTEGNLQPPATAGGSDQSEARERDFESAVAAAASADGVVLSGDGPDILPPKGGTPNRVGIVHRLDKDTSGLIVVAKDEQTHEALSEQFRKREVFKSYVALVHGSTHENSGTIDRPLARDRWHRTKMTVAANGRHALSLWKVRKRFEKFTLLEVDIRTGRTHQIRVHLASINHPVVGDATYNEGRDKTIADHEIKKAVEKLNRFFLHAEELSFAHPITSEKLEFIQPIGEELETFLSKIQKLS